MSTATLEKPKSKGRKTKPKPIKALPGSEMWSRIDARSKPSKAASNGGMRPVLTCGYIRHEKKASYLYCTNSYILVALPITMEHEGEPLTLEQRKAVLPEAALVPAALKALDKSKRGEFRIVGGLFEVSDDPALFRVEEQSGQPPNFRDLLGGDKGLEDGVELKEVGFNPTMLKNVCDALGVEQSGVALSFVGPLRPIKVRGLNNVPGEALIMPIRLHI